MIDIIHILSIIISISINVDNSLIKREPGCACCNLVDSRVVPGYNFSIDWLFNNSTRFIYLRVLSTLDITNPLGEVAALKIQKLSICISFELFLKSTIFSFLTYILTHNLGLSQLLCIISESIMWLETGIDQ